MRNLNATPHKINIFLPEQVYYDEKTRKHFLKSPKEEQPIKVIEPSGKLLNAKVSYILKETKEGIPIFVAKPETIDPIPEDYDIIIASNLYASYAIQFNLPNLDKLYTISQPVYIDKENPKPIGCLGLNKVKP